MRKTKNKKPTVTEKRGSESNYEKQVDKNHYMFENYLSLERWSSYYYQIKSVQEISKILGKENMLILEIGVGDGNVNSVLRNMGYKVITMDIDKELNPDHVASLPNINSGKNKEFDCVLCCEVLEHIRYEDAEKSLVSMAKRARVSVISVPHKSIFLSFSVKLWFFKTLKWFLSVRSFRKLELGGEHYWELDANGVTTKRFKNSIENAGFKILNDYRIPEFPFHHFFIVKSQVL